MNSGVASKEPALPHDRPSREMPGSNDWMGSGLIRWPVRMLLGTAAVGAFHLALVPGLELAILLFPFLVLPLVRAATARQAFYWGLALGFALYGPQLGFFWKIFGPAALVLWAVLAFWVGLFLALGNTVWRRLSGWTLVLLAPVLWTGCEYFRSELYFLRFSWLTPGQVLGPRVPGLLHHFGSYGIGTILFLGGAWFCFGPRGWHWLGLLTATMALLGQGGDSAKDPPGVLLRVGGVQAETCPESQLPRALDALVGAHPETELVLLPEYSLDGRPGGELTDWCRKNRRYLVVGGREILGGGEFRNTAWVVGTNGSVVFSQAKSVPIQFFRDGLPAESQRLWSSPWGPLAIAICYDLSYSRVMDRWVTMGAEALLIPTMDVYAWGSHEHSLHGRMAGVRSAEYGLPTVRCASSGSSQIVDANGHVTAGAPTSDEVLFFAGTIRLRGRGSLPLDRWWAPASALATGGVWAAMAAFALEERGRRRRASKTA